MADVLPMHLVLYGGYPADELFTSCHCLAGTPHEVLLLIMALPVLHTGLVLTNASVLQIAWTLFLVVDIEPVLHTLIIALLLVSPVLHTSSSFRC